MAVGLRASIESCLSTPKKLIIHGANMICTKCKDNRNKNKFYERKDRPYGKRYRSICKKCTDNRDSHYRLSNPERTNARNKARQAVRDGWLNSPKCCEWCAEKPPCDMHHEDYSRPYEVMWLCRGCHRRIHALENALSA